MSSQALAAFSKQTSQASSFIPAKESDKKQVEECQELQAKEGDLVQILTSSSSLCGLTGTLLFYSEQQESNVETQQVIMYPNTSVHPRWLFFLSTLFAAPVGKSLPSAFTQTGPNVAWKLNITQVKLWMVKLQDGHWFSVGLEFFCTMSTNNLTTQEG